MRADIQTGTNTAQVAADTRNIVCVTAAGSEYGIDVSVVLGVNPLMAITPVPGAPRHIRGVVKIRGRAIPVVELAEMIGLTGGAAGSKPRIVIVRAAGELVGLLVDGVTRVISARLDVTGVPPACESVTRCLEGVARFGDEIVFLIDVNAVLDVRGALSGQSVCGGEDAS